MRVRKHDRGKFVRDLVIVALSIVITLLLVRIGALQEFLSVAQEAAIIGSFVAGIFFTSVFTLAPAAIALAEISQHSAPLTVALWGGLGAACGDLVLFLFVRDVFSQDLSEALPLRRIRRFLSPLHYGSAGWLLPFVGALIIASPLPDELGIGLMGLSKIRPLQFVIVSFIMNAIGIYAIALVARAI
ncbi:hypothetical protein HY968_03365 [Candidatus Kaiserbacteria bacterium]|nr:hypothetical protein [Candidatus Kaiserbacteria bacterium]